MDFFYYWHSLHIGPMYMDFFLDQVFSLFFVKRKGFFFRIRERFAHLCIKVEKFETNNALLVSALGGIQDYSCGLDHPTIHIHILILHNRHRKYSNSPANSERQVSLSAY